MDPRTAGGSGDGATQPPLDPSTVPRDVKVLSWVSFFQDTASEMLYPILPIFITTVIGAPAAVVGLVEGVAEATAAVTKGVSGRMADTRRRRPFIVFGYSLSTVAKPLIALAAGWPMVLAARFLDRFGKGVRTAPRDALITDETHPRARGRSFGMHRAADTAGAVVGPLLGLAAYRALDGRLRLLFVLAVIPAAISVGLVLLVRERPVPRPATAPPAGHLAWRDLGPRYWRLITFLGLFALVNFTDALLLLRARDLGFGIPATFLVYVLYNVVYAASAYPAGALSDRVPRRLVFGTGLVVFAVAYVGLGLARTAGWVWVLLPAYGLYTGLTDGVGKAWVADHAPTGRSGSAMGAYQLTTGLGALAAGLWAGLAWGDDGRLPLLVSGAVGAVLALACLIGPVPRQGRPDGARTRSGSRRISDVGSSSSSTTDQPHRPARRALPSWGPVAIRSSPTSSTT